MLFWHMEVAKKMLEDKWQECTENKFVIIYILFYFKLKPSPTEKDLNN